LSALADTPRARAAQPLVRRLEERFQGAKQRDLLARAWLPDAPWAAALIVHGLGEHSGRYEHVGSWLASRGIAACSYDHQGHGLSSGHRCHVGRFSDLLDDAEIALERVRSSWSGLPVFVVGHSMGGLVTASLACDRKPDVAGFVTSGAALARPASISRTRLWLLLAVRRLAPRLSFENGLDAAGLSRDPGVVQAYLDDPLVHRRITTSLAGELFRAMDRTLARGGQVERPLLALHGEEDPICGPAGSREFAAAAASGRYLGFPGLRHEIFNEPEREQVLECVLEWLREISGTAA
jgi:alpha-beta hydrolase superfamily lysophospholipase